MNALQKELYTTIDKLVADESNPFVAATQEKDGKFYRIFVYQMANYNDFLAPYSRECRGITFEVDKDNQPIRLASLTPHKFFNDSENDFTKDLDYSQIELIMDKLDGSIMSTYIHSDSKGREDVFLKSKGSLSSDQAKAANALLNTEAFENFKRFLFETAKKDITLNMEFTSNKPEFRIVLRHDDERLTVFSARNHSDLSYLKYDELKALMENYGVSHQLVPNYRDKYADDFNGFIKSIRDMEDEIEGYVVVIKDGETAKLKTLKYAERHKAKGGVMDSPRLLFETVVSEEHDDLRGAFPDDEYLMGIIDDMETKVKSAYQEIHKHSIGFYEANRELSVKDYAILAKKSNLGYYFGLAMNLKNGFENDYKEFLLNHWKEFRDDSFLIDPKANKKAKTKIKY